MGITGEYISTHSGKTYCYAGTWQSAKHSLDWAAKVHLDAVLAGEPYGAIGGASERDDAVHVKRMIEDIIERHIATR